MLDSIGHDFQGSLSQDDHISYDRMRRRSSIYCELSVPPSSAEPSISKLEDPPSVTFFYKILELSCKAKIIPFNWNATLRRFSSVGATDLWGHGLINLHSVIMYSVTIFSFFRLVTNVGKERDAFPLMMKIVNVSWLLASIQISVIFLQNWFLRGDVMQYGNAILDKISIEG